MSWDHRKWGSREDPCRQSDFNDVASSYGCAQRFAYRKKEIASGVVVERNTVAAAPTCGTAGHETIKRALSNEGVRNAMLRDGHIPPVERLVQVFSEELARAAIKDKVARTIEWYGDDPQEARYEYAWMVRGLLTELAERAVEIVACEAPFLVQLGDYWMQGTIDLGYRPRVAPTTLALADWKFGQQRLPQVILDHGYQTGVYAEALANGFFWPGTPDERRIGEFPQEIHIVHLRDYLPYSKRTSKSLERPEELAFFSKLMGKPLAKGVEIAILPAEREIKLKKNGEPYKERETTKNLPEVILSDRRGPAWYRARRKPEDIAELRVDVRRVISTVRLGAFLKSKDEHCTRCPYRGTCLGDGFGPTGDEARDLEQVMRGVTLDGTGTDGLAA